MSRVAANMSFTARSRSGTVQPGTRSPSAVRGVSGRRCSCPSPREARSSWEPTLSASAPLGLLGSLFINTRQPLGSQPGPLGTVPATAHARWQLRLHPDPDGSRLPSGSTSAHGPGAQDGDWPVVSGTAPAPCPGAARPSTWLLTSDPGHLGCVLTPGLAQGRGPHSVLCAGSALTSQPHLGAATTGRARLLSHPRPSRSLSPCLCQRPPHAPSTKPPSARLPDPSQVCPEGPPVPTLCGVPPTVAPGRPIQLASAPAGAARDRGGAEEGDSAPCCRSSCTDRPCVWLFRAGPRLAGRQRTGGGLRVRRQVPAGSPYPSAPTGASSPPAPVTVTQWQEAAPWWWLTNASCSCSPEGARLWVMLSEWNVLIEIFG
ncbi:hypothetical protein HJG60_009631 [Phyllostomus discolor]|uniref:Uncharacterized protein n=1 Tax=Phyllostomus discolor TaxID=89673 RepID=A0A833YEF4_9CHIR|nr:hypothetical protein HJG60_009631 [Phyllostomus discolor]